MKDATRQLKLNKFYVKVDLRDEFDSKIEDIEFDKKKIEKIKRLLKHQTIKYGTIKGTTDMIDASDININLNDRSRSIEVSDRSIYSRQSDHQDTRKQKRNNKSTDARNKNKISKIP